MRPIVGIGSRDRSGDPPPAIYIDLSSTSVTVVVGTTFNAPVVTATLANGSGSGTWTLVMTGNPAGRSNFLRLRTTTGASVTVEVSRTVLGEDISAAWQWRLEYLGDGLGSPVSKTFTVSVIVGTQTIAAVPADPVLTLPVASGVTVTTLTVNTAGSGTWSTRTDNWSKFSLAATTGKSVIVRTNAALAAGDVGTRKVSVRYVGDGFSGTNVAVDAEVRAQGTTPTWKWGLSDNGTYSGGDTDLLETYKNAFGVHPKSMTIFSGVGQTTWASMASSMNNTTSYLYKVLAWCKDNNVMPVITLPICQPDDLIIDAQGARGDFSKVNNGDYDTAIVTFAQRVRNLFGTREIVFRLGHEPTHFPWRISKGLHNQEGGVQSAKNAWARVATKLRQGMGTGHNALTNYCHTIAWDGNKEGSLIKKKGIGFLMQPPFNRTRQEAMLEFFPGTAYIDILSWDFYDDPNPLPNITGTTSNYSTWLPKRKEWYDVAVNLDLLYGVDEYGLKRKIGYDGGSNTFTYPNGETTNKAHLAGGGDNPDFITFAHKMFSEHSSSRLIYTNYFRMFEAGWKRADIMTGTLNSKDVIHMLSGRSGATPAGKSCFQGKSDGSFTTMNGEVVGWDYATATGNAYKKYKDLFHPPAT